MKDLCARGITNIFPGKGKHEPTISGRQAENVDTNHDGCHNTTRMCTSNLHHVQPLLVQRCVHNQSLALSLRSSLQIRCCEIVREPGVGSNNRIKLSQPKVRHDELKILLQVETRLRPHPMSAGTTTDRLSTRASKRLASVISSSTIFCRELGHLNNLHNQLGSVSLTTCMIFNSCWALMVFWTFLTDVPLRHETPCINRLQK